MAKRKYEDLQSLTESYGKKTFAFLQNVKTSGKKIVSAYADYLGGPKTAVSAVPPHGDFDSLALYRDEAFDCYGRSVIFLEPISMGICTKIENKSDDGATFVRTVIEFHPMDAGLLIHVGSQSEKFHIVNGLETVGDQICEAIFQDVHRAFSLELDQAQGRSRIGFLPNTI
ncbi:hypothetical protein [Donghicola sp.]|jgi:hypothetical protein|uniref:hypothetical protein n=1 Tax=Donghicola sp. TaxID=1929294 RepID=UPI0025DED64E|nr:hypothetical protein [Donghicola sp.]MCT4577542.1 hypothetical protein [Donghicola sp.]